MVDLAFLPHLPAALVALLMGLSLLPFMIAAETLDENANPTDPGNDSNQDWWLSHTGTYVYLDSDSGNEVVATEEPPPAGDEGAPTETPKPGYTLPTPPDKGDYPAPLWMQPFLEKFLAPTADDLLKDPSFLGRLKASQQAIERSAASRGTLLTGGVLKGLSNNASDYASNEYSRVYERAMNDYLNRANIHYTNEGNRYNSQRSNRLDNWGIASDEFNMLKGNVLSQFDMDRATANDTFSQLYSLASLTNPAAVASLYGNYGNVGSNILSNVGNAYAAGGVGSSNAWSTALQNAGNIGNSAFLAWLKARPTVGG